MLRDEIMTAYFSSLIAATCVTVYWLTVAIKCVRISRVLRKDPNVIPRERTGQLIRLAWAPALATWIVYPWLYLRQMHAPGFPWNLIATGGAAAGVLALVATFHCWREMGTSWRIGIDPNEKTTMIVGGAYRYVRHPIYGLSSLLMLGTLATTPTIIMLVVAAMHTLLMQVEARREEKYMLRAHGKAYQDYMQSTGRFLPHF